jgi:two-component system response regulator PhoP
MQPGFSGRGRRRPSHHVRFKLESDGFSVYLANSGETALELAFQRRSDLGLLDIGLSDMDGLLRADARTLSMPVVILSSWDDPELIWRGFELGAIEYGVSTEATPARVSAYLRRSLDHDAGRRQRGSSAGASQLSGMRLRPGLRR